MQHLWRRYRLIYLLANFWISNSKKCQGIAYELLCTTHAEQLWSRYIYADLIDLIPVSYDIAQRTSSKALEGVDWLYRIWTTLHNDNSVSRRPKNGYFDDYFRQSTNLHLFRQQPYYHTHLQLQNLRSSEKTGKPRLTSANQQGTAHSRRWGSWESGSFRESYRNTPRHLKTGWNLQRTKIQMRAL